MDIAPADLPCANRSFQQPFVYQTMVCSGYEPIAPDRYLAALGQAYGRVFGKELRLDTGSMTREAWSVLSGNSYHLGSMNFLTVRAYPDGRVEYIPAGTSMYGTWGLRALRPSVVTVADACAPRHEFSSLCLTCASYLDMEAARSGAHRAIALDHSGMVLCIGASPLVAVIGGNVYHQPCAFGVEMELLSSALRKRNRRMEERALSASDLTDADELMFIDHEGLSSVLSCDGKYYSDVVAASAGEQMGDMIDRLTDKGGKRGRQVTR